MSFGARMLDFSLGKCHLSLRYHQLVIEREGFPVESVPMRDIAVVIMASRRVTMSLCALDGLVSHGASVVVCGEDMLPTGMMLPLAGHFQQTQRMLAQASAPLPRLKRIWKEIVQAKVRAQGSLLKVYRGDDAGIMKLALKVKSGDPLNIEAQAAQRYWPLLFGDAGFRRRFDAPDQNAALNYGYAVLRATVGRAICAAGLHPSLGVHHHGRNNPFCLADDLMEPYRPLIDGEVANLCGESSPAMPTLDPKTKERLVMLLHLYIGHDGVERPIIDWIGRSAASLARRVCGESDEAIFFPDALVKP